MGRVSLAYISTLYILAATALTAADKFDAGNEDIAVGAVYEVSVRYPPASESIDPAP